MITNIVHPIGHYYQNISFNLQKKTLVLHEGTEKVPF